MSMPDEAQALCAAIHAYLAGTSTFTDLRQFRARERNALAALTDPRAVALASALHRAIADWLRGTPEDVIRYRLKLAAMRAKLAHLWFFEIPP